MDIMHCNIMHAAFGKKVRVLSGAFQHSITPFISASQRFTYCRNERQNQPRKERLFVIQQYLGAFLQPLLQWKSNKVLHILSVCL